MELLLRQPLRDRDLIGVHVVEPRLVGLERRVCVCVNTPNWTDGQTETYASE